jgi:3-oxoacyl-[acyl-carrier-protein] synthase III
MTRSAFRDDKEKTMTENTVNETTQNVIESFRATNQVVTESIVAAQERNMKFVQSTLTNAMEVMKSHIEATRELMQELEQQAKMQRDAFQKLVPGQEASQWMKLYQDALHAPFSPYQQALEAAEKATEQGREIFQKAIENFERTARQPQHAAKGEART